MKYETIFETPTKKGWLCIHKMGEGEYIQYNVTLNENKTPFTGIKRETLTERNAREYAQGLFDGIECL